MLWPLFEFDQSSLTLKDSPVITPNLLTISIRHWKKAKESYGLASRSFLELNIILSKNYGSQSILTTRRR